MPDITNQQSSNRLQNIQALKDAIAALKSATATTERFTALKNLTDVLTRLGYVGNTKPARTPDDELIDGTDDDYSDNTNDDNYRYADTGHIAGSHKDRAKNRIKELSESSLTVKATDIDWGEIESDALLAEDVIKKSNILGDIDYQHMKDNGGDAGTAFLIQKVFASIAPRPHWDIEQFIKKSNSGQRLIYNQKPIDRNIFFEALKEYSAAEQKKAARKAYVNGINTLKARIIGINDARLLIAELKLIAGELSGIKVDANAETEYSKYQSEMEKLANKVKGSFQEYLSIYEAEKLIAKKNMALPEGRDINDIHLIFDDKETAFKAGEPITDFWQNTRMVKNFLESHYSGKEFVIMRGNQISALAAIVSKSDYDDYLEVETMANQQMLLASLNGFKDENANLAWISLGERFWSIVELTSGSFVKHANTAIRKRYDDWGLVIKDATKTDSDKKPMKKKSTFELIVADNIERIGGRPIGIGSTQELKDTFGFRDIQSGNWVLKDKASAKFHVENAAAAMMDLSDIVGIDEKSLAFGGRLALALGARGKSGALAHYEPVQRVINITKMKGGGSLGHEWFHAIDNILGEVLNVDGGTGANVFLSKDSSILGDTKLNAAFSELRSAMHEGDERATESFLISQSHVDLAIRNIKTSSRVGSPVIIRDNTAEQAVIMIDANKTLRSGKRTKDHSTWRNIAVAYHNQDKVGQIVRLKVGRPVSKFYAESKKLDEGRAKPYWSTTLEMAARAFQAFLEDSLKEKGRRSDYLSYGADNNLYGGNHQAYPEGAERLKINAVFKRLFAVIKEEQIFENAAKNTAMMDSIFGSMLEVYL